MLDQSSLSHDLPKSPEDIKTMLDTTSTEPPKKRRRVAKPNAEKKFECKHDGCGKSYSRAEHLYRHQLNRRLVSTTQGISTNYQRHSEDHFSMRLPRLQPLFRSPGPMHTTPREAHDTRLPITQARYLRSVYQSTESSLGLAATDGASWHLQTT